MRVPFPRAFVRRLSISQKFFIIIALVALILLVELGSFGFAMNTTSAIRAYVGGEGLWSKSQKESLDALLRYSETYNESDYERFLSYLALPAGDNKARLELSKPNPNVSVARAGFIDGGNNPADVDGMIFLFRNFRHISYMEKAIAIWTQGDALIQEQIRIGSEIHDIVSRARDTSAVRPRIDALVAQAVDNDTSLTALENEFSSTLGEASRQIGWWLLLAILSLTIVLGCCAALIAAYISRILTQVDRAKSEFVAFASHQLRAPLNVISLSVDTLQRDGRTYALDETDAITRISREVWRMSSLIRSILDVTKIESGTLDADPKPTDLIEVSKEEAESARVEARKRGISLRESYAERSIEVKIDPIAMRVVLQNLLSNAIKYTSRGTITLSIMRTGGRAQICVEDTGHGIPPADQPHIFDKLYRAKNAPAADRSGTGLGLYIVKSVVLEAGGTIWIDSREGIGTKVFVALPIAS